MRIALTIMLMLASAPAWAEWTKVGETAGSVHYLDAATIGKDGNLRRVWEIQDLKARLPSGEVSRRAMSEYDCAEQRFRMLSVSSFMGLMSTGEILLTGSDPESLRKWQSIPQGTIAQATLKLVCAR